MNAPRPFPAALGAIAATVLIIGGAVAGFVVTRDERSAPTTTTQPTLPEREQYVAAIAAALPDALPIALNPVQSDCVASAVVDAVDPDELQELAAAEDPLGAVADGQRQRLLRGLVTCVDPIMAEALLAGSTTTIPISALPDEGT